MTYDQFFNQYNGKGIDFDNYYGFQCVDLADQYAKDVVGKLLPGVAGAKDFWNLKSIDGYDKITNTPTGVPLKGDIVIWGTGVGPYGHIAIFDNGDSNSFVSFDQNWPLNSLCHLQNHNYTGVLGWFHPKSVAPQPTPPAAQPPVSIKDDEKRALQVLKDHFNDASDLDGKPFGNLEGYANTLTQDCYKSWKKPPVLSKPLAFYSSTDLLMELVGRLKG